MTWRVLALGIGVGLALRAEPSDFSGFELSPTRFDSVSAPCLSASNRERDVIAEYLDTEGNALLRAGSWLGRDGRYLLPLPDANTSVIRFRALEELAVEDRHVRIEPCPADLPQAGIDALTHAIDARLDAYLGEALETGAVGNAFHEALGAFQASGHEHWLAVVHYEYAAFLRSTDRLDQARSHYGEARDRFAAIGDDAGRAAAINTLGLVALRQGDFDLADKRFGHALPLFMELGDRHHVAGVNNNLGLLEMRRGRLTEAAGYLDFALSILQGPIDLRAARPHIDAEMPDDGAAELTWALNTLSNLAIVRRRQGAVDLAERYWRNYLAVEERIDWARGPAQTRYNLGALMLRQGRLEEAMLLLGRALEQFEAIDARRWSAETRVMLSVLYFRLGDTELAMDFARQAIAQSPEDLGARVRAHQHMARLEREADNLDAALELYDTALGFIGEHGANRERLLVESERAHTALAAGRVAQAREVQQRILQALESEEETSLAAQVRYRLAMTWLRDGIRERAEPLLIRARAVFEDTGDIYYELLALDALGEVYADEPARQLEYGERALDRALALRRQPLTDLRRIGLAATLERIEDTHIDRLVKHGRSGDAWETAERLRATALIDLRRKRTSKQGGQQRRALLDEHAQALERLHRMRLNDRDAMDGDEASALRLRIDRIETRLQQSHKMAEWPPGPDLDEVSQSLSTGQLLLSFYELPDRLLLWAVTSSQSRFLEIQDVPALREDIRQLLHRLRSPRQALGAIDQLSRSLGERIFGPVGDMMTGAESLIIQPHGELHALPFAILIHEDRVLIDRFSLRLALTARTQAHSTSAEETDRLLVIADPEWEASTLGNPTVPGESLMGRLMRGNAVSQLPGTAREAESLRSLSGPRMEVSLRTGPRASRQFLEEGGLAGYSMVHFATHGLLDLNYPALSALLLADGRAPGPAFLRAGDIAALDLEAELVVLSGCETGRGPVAAGEGALSLARPFLVAGSREVMSTMWKIDDARTAGLMAAFYRHMLREESSAAEALAAAQRQMQDDRATSHPFYWAGFSVTGLTLLP